MGIENPVHLIFIAAIALIFLGPKRLPDLAKALGHGIREFREAISDGEDGGPIVTPAPAAPPAPAAHAAPEPAASSEQAVAATAAGPPAPASEPLDSPEQRPPTPGA